MDACLPGKLNDGFNFCAGHLFQFARIHAAFRYVAIFKYRRRNVRNVRNVHGRFCRCVAYFGIEGRCTCPQGKDT